MSDLSDLLKEAEAQSSADRPSSAKVFLAFRYPETKDLLKHFLTLISASLVFSITFSEKIIDFNKATIGARIVVICAWALLILALGASGVGIYTLYLAANRAIAAAVLRQRDGFEKLARTSYWFQDMAGVLFGLGLRLLVLAAIMKF
jgi:hypothetical protein